MTRGCHGRGAPTRWFRLEQTNKIPKYQECRNYFIRLSGGWIRNIWGGSRLLFDFLLTHFIFCTLPGFQAVRPQLWLPHIGQRLPHSQVILQIQFWNNWLNFRIWRKTFQNSEKYINWHNIHRPGIKTKKTLHSALDTKKITAQNTLIKTKIFPQVFLDCNFVFHRIRKLHKLNPILAMISLN